MVLCWTRITWEWPEPYNPDRGQIGMFKIINWRLSLGNQNITWSWSASTWKENLEYHFLPWHYYLDVWAQGECNLVDQPVLLKISIHQYWHLAQQWTRIVWEWSEQKTDQGQIQLFEFIIWRVFLGNQNMNQSWMSTGTCHGLSFVSIILFIIQFRIQSSCKYN